MTESPGETRGYKNWLWACKRGRPSLEPTFCPPASPTLIKSILLSFRLLFRSPVPPCAWTTTIFFGKVFDARDKRNPLLHCVCFTQGEVWCFPHWSSRPPTDTLSNISSIQQRYQLPLPGLSTEPGLWAALNKGCLGGVGYIWIES